MVWGSLARSVGCVLLYLLRICMCMFEVVVWLVAWDVCCKYRLRICVCVLGCGLACSVGCVLLSLLRISMCVFWVWSGCFVVCDLWLVSHASGQYSATRSQGRGAPHAPSGLVLSRTCRRRTSSPHTLARPKLKTGPAGACWGAVRGGCDGWPAFSSRLCAFAVNRILRPQQPYFP